MKTHFSELCSHRQKIRKDFDRRSFPLRWRGALNFPTGLFSLILHQDELLGRKKIIAKILYFLFHTKHVALFFYSINTSHVKCINWILDKF